MNGIFNRYSVRKFTGEPLEKEKIDLLVKAAFAAPSARNKQPWEFLLVTQRPMLEKMSKTSPYAGMLTEAALGVCICMDEKRWNNLEHAIEDCAAAAENMLVQAADMGLGGVWLGVLPDTDRVEKIRTLFALPDGVIPLCMLAIGHPAAPGKPKDKYNETRVHWEKW